MHMKRKGGIRLTLTTQIKSRGLLDHAIQSLGLKLPHLGFYIRDNWCYWFFHFITLFLVSTLTCYWDYDKILAGSQSSRKLEVFMAKAKDGWRGRLQVEGSWLDAGEILACVLGHLNRRTRLSASDHVPPHVQLKKKLIVTSWLVIGIPTTWVEKA